MADNYYWIRLERKVQLNQLKYADEVKEVLWGNGLISKTAPYAIYEGSYKSNGEWKDAVLVVSKASRRTVLHRCLFRRETVNGTEVLHRAVNLLQMNELSCCSVDDYKDAVGATERIWWFYLKAGKSCECRNNPTVGLRLSCMQDNTEITKFINENLVNC